MGNVIAPLERLGNVVDVFYVDQPCHMQSELLAILHANVRGTLDLKKNAIGKSKIKKNTLAAVEFFKKSVGRTAAGRRRCGGVRCSSAQASKYDLFLMVRIDQMWLQPL